MIGKIEQDQAAKSKAAPAARADIGVEKNPSKAAFQSHLLPSGNERSEINTTTASLIPSL